MPDALGGQIVLWWRRERQLAQAIFHDRLPDGDYAQGERVLRVTNPVTPVHWQPDVPTDEPQENVGIEEEPHRPSKACRRSSGSGASKSSGTVNSPAHKPNGRSVLAPFVAGFISTTGCPARTMTTVSP